MMKRALCVCGFLALWLPTCITAQVDVKASLDSARIMIGDQVRLKISVTYPPSATLSPPNVGVMDTLKTIEILQNQATEPVPIGDNLRREYNFLLTSFDSGVHWIPALPIVYTLAGKSDTTYSIELPLEVRTVPMVSDSTELAPIKSIVKEPLRLGDYLPIVAGIVCIAALAWLLWYFLSRKKTAPLAIAEIQKPAHEIAFEKLEALGNAKLWQQGKLKQFHSELTFILREYIENKYHLQALELTTDEILVQFPKTGLPEILGTDLKKILTVADLVKFAKAEPPVDAHDISYKEAKKFIEDSHAISRMPSERMQEGDGAQLVDNQST